MTQAVDPQTSSESETSSHLFASYAVTPVPLFDAPDDVSHQKVVEALTEAVENGRPVDLPLGPTAGGVATFTNSLSGTGTITADSDSDSDTDYDTSG